jgi:hypothetical protein
MASAIHGWSEMNATTGENSSGVDGSAMILRLYAESSGSGRLGFRIGSPERQFRRSYGLVTVCPA